MFLSLLDLRSIHRYYRYNKCPLSISSTLQLVWKDMLYYKSNRQTCITYLLKFFWCLTILWRLNNAMHCNTGKENHWILMAGFIGTLGFQILPLLMHCEEVCRSIPTFLIGFKTQQYRPISAILQACVWLPCLLQADKGHGLPNICIIYCCTSH